MTADALARRPPFPLAWLLLALLLPLVVLAPVARADLAEVHAPGGVALSGYDAVAYFREGRAVEGQRDHVLKWRGAMWYFASAANQEAFEMDPFAYAPQYGGYCAFGASEGAMSGGNPQIFIIRERRLYLMGSQAARQLWLADPDGHQARADAYWHEVAGR